MRKNNKMDMTVTEQIYAIVEDFCLHYCKYRDTWDEKKEGCELLESEHCRNCPFGELT